MIGRTISHYKILEKLGEGGMGVVYKAEDIKLKRTVALKFLRRDILPSEQDKTRFVYEARAASALDHSNICSIHEIEETEDHQMFISMPFYEGETLRAKIQRSPLKVALALDIAIQIAQGLEEAHEKGIVHRDIKSGNIIVTPRGQVKIMDFGLAKSDRTTRLTTTGVTLGTVAYMSPEQVRGERVDHRTDIWSTGVVLYEMISGRLPFQAEHEQAAMYMILNQDPEPLTALRTGVPMELERITNKAMAKRPAERYQGASEFTADLRALQRKLESEEASAPSAGGLTAPRPWLAGRKAIRNGIIALGAVLCVFIVMQMVRERSLPSSRPRQVTNEEAWQTAPVISPDGGRIAYASNESGDLDVYDVDVHGGNRLNLTQAPSFDDQPKWFPDGASIAFVSDRDGEQGIWKVGQFGGSATLLVSNATCPAISPDGKKIAFSRANANGELRIAVASLEEPGNAMILTGDNDGLWDHVDPAWSPDGSKICYSARHNLWCVPSSGGNAWPVTTDETLDSQPAWSPGGKRIYFSSFRESTLALWRVSAKGGRPQRVTMGVGGDCWPSISRDGKRLVYCTQASQRDLVIRDLVSGKETRSARLKGGSMVGVAPDKSKIVFTSDRWGQKYDLWIQPLDSHGAAIEEPRRLTDHPGNASLPTFSPDGNWVAYYRILGKERDIWVVASEGGRPVRFTDDPANESDPAWSPDGSTLAFVSERGRRSQIWVAPVKNGNRAGPPTEIATQGISAASPSWSPDGKFIAFQGVTGKDREAWVVPVDRSAPPRQVTRGAGASRVRWESSGNSLLVSGTWGQRRMMLKRVSLKNGEAREVAPPVLFGPETTVGLFDVSRDGELLVYRKEDLKGNIWMLEAEKGSY